MTGNVVGSFCGIGIATLGMAGGMLTDNVLQNGISLTGTALMAWYVVQLHKELRTERTERRKEHNEDLKLLYQIVRESKDACKNCNLTRNVNDLASAVQEVAKDHITSEHEPKKNTISPQSGTAKNTGTIAE